MIISSPDLTDKEYMKTTPVGKYSINVIVGDFQRTKLYAQKGYQIPQKIPKDVWNAYQELVKLGYSHALVAES